jgi:N-acetyl-1-D-myo-inositol-2-amino-2-deoxy-alpha-D-glucopyranoside deacetylase
MTAPPSDRGGLLVVSAHPDDEVLLAGGTLAAIAAAGIPTAVVCFTRGELGPIADPALATSETLGRVRVHELEASCAALGVGWVKCFSLQDGALAWCDSAAIVRRLERILSLRRPNAVVTFGEDGLYWHADHIATHRFTRRAVRRLAVYRGTISCRDPEGPPDLYRAIWPTEVSCALVRELEARGLPHDLWGLAPEEFGVGDEHRQGELVLDVRRFAHRKLRALRCHRTQLDSDHAMRALPDELAEPLLGFERFALLHAGRGGGGAGWLERTLGTVAVG